MVNASANWDKWNKIAQNMINHENNKVKIAMVGKYVTLTDSYVSVNHALKHAGAQMGKSIDIDWIDSESITDYNILSNYDGILVPGGFGTTRIRGRLFKLQIMQGKKTYHILEYVSDSN